MQKRMIGILIISVLFIFLSIGFISAQTPSCSVIARGSCTGNSKIVMGISALTNAHGQLNGQTPAYDYVLCCNFGDGVQTGECIDADQNGKYDNKIIGLSADTNAHAEIPGGTVYTTYNVCYEDLLCTYTTDPSCPTDYIETVSLSASTNAHIASASGTGSYTTKICCSTVKYAPCNLQSAYWSIDGTTFAPITDGDSAPEGTPAYLVVKGTAGCDKKSVSLEVKEYDSLSSSDTITTISAGFTGSTAKGSWTTTYQDSDGVANNNEYFFIATVSGTSETRNSNAPLLKVTKQDPAWCINNNILVCGDYPDSPTCELDNEINIEQGNDMCGVSVTSAPSEWNCADPSIICKCEWDATAEPDICKPNFGVVKSQECGNGYTLCYDDVSGLDYCYYGASCPTGDKPITNNDGVCDEREGCSSADCDGKQDNCASGTTCSGGKCYSATLPIEEPDCDYDYTLCNTEPLLGTGMDYCFPGNDCPDGDDPFTNNNDVCEPELGEGCLSVDCKDGDRDSCSAITYCLGGTCYSVEGPELLGTCRYTEQTSGSCREEGGFISTLRATWAGDPEDKPANCRDIERSIRCPAQAKLPFFNVYSLIGAIVLIALIYLVLTLKKKKMKLKKVSSKRKRKGKR